MNLTQVSIVILVVTLMYSYVLAWCMNSINSEYNFKNHQIYNTMVGFLLLVMYIVTLFLIFFLISYASH